MKLKKSLSEILTGITTKSTSGHKYSMTRYRGKKDLFDVTVEALTFRNKSKRFDVGVYKRTQVKPDTAEYGKLLKQYGHLRFSGEPERIVSVPVLAEQFLKPEDVLKTLRDLK